MSLTVERLGTAFAPSPGLRGATLGAGTVIAFAAAEGGFFPSSWRLGAVALLAVAILLALWAPVRPTKATLVLAGTLAAFAALSLASAAWSADPAASVLDVQRTLLYLAGLASFVLAGEGLAAGVAVGAGVVGAWALVARAVTGAHRDPYEGTLLTGPIGYANGLGALTAIGIVLSLAFAIRDRRPLYALPIGFLVPVLFLTGSRASVPATALGCTVAFALQRRQRVLATLVVLAASCALAALLVLTPHALGERASYWSAARSTVAAHPFGGTGAGTYGVVHQQAPYARDAHSLYLQVLSELGPGGLVLVALALGLPLALSIRRGLVAPAAGLTVFVLHAGVDWDWQLPAVTLAAFALAADATRKRSVKSDYPLV